MSEKISIKELLEGVEVEWKPLGEVANYEQPTKYLVKSKNYSNEFKIPVLTAGKTFILGFTDEITGLYEASKKPVIIFDDFTTANKWVDFDFKSKSSAMKMITSKDESEVLLKYIYYWLNTLPSDLIDGDHKRQWISNFSTKLIPIPSLEVQSEIVRILDNFTELTAELTAELTSRKKQYEYYETKLLFENNYEMVPLGQLCTVNQGLQIPISDRKTEAGENRYFYITVQFLKGIDEKYYIESPSQSVICDYDDILVTRTGSTGKIITGVKGCFHNNFFKVNCFENINKRYMYTVLNSKVMFGKLLQVASGGTVPDLPHNKFYKINIPLPSLEEQERIVSILDKFDTLTNSISKGLPKEIELRQKQYEYYRDLLLTFPKKGIEI
ncbi:restriction endonuclease subunit S [Aliarcobacter vitoriensis]|uniref:Restriction endonuclease subunit M n=1 Tax=Aliarcobacter vitoriensis TaxID=2011099 RepID=A0A366MXF2_9BACT|nr:restriction endonuclease subunit S [Aliarcobacter vitoriensis]RBQ30092.1 restriction endonuclease subunit M [Aliarcobacter vitoriensis]